MRSHFSYVSPTVFPEAYVNTFGIGTPPAGLRCTPCSTCSSIEHDCFWWWHGAALIREGLCACRCGTHAAEPWRSSRRLRVTPGSPAKASSNARWATRCASGYPRIGACSRRWHGPATGGRTTTTRAVRWSGSTAGWAAAWDEAAKGLEVQYRCGTRASRCSGQKREGGSALPGEVCQQAVSWTATRVERCG